MKWISTAFVALVTLGCGATSREAVAQTTPSPRPSAWRATAELPEEATPPEAPPTTLWDDPIGAVQTAARRAEPGARRVLEAMHTMLAEGTVVRGSCYAWTNAVYHRAGGRPQDVFHPARHGQYADASLLRPGDWVFFINHSFGNVTHSAIFVGWIDEGARTAMMASYPGGNRDSPGRFSGYELTNVYRVVRMGDDPTGAPRSP
jgi:hypothetical protein